MVALKDQNKRSSQADSSSDGRMGYHEVLIDTGRSWSESLTLAQHRINKPDAVSRPTILNEAQKIRSMPRMELARFSYESVGALTEIGDRLLKSGIVGNNELLSRGKLLKPLLGMPTSDGIVTIARELLEVLAQDGFDVHRSANLRFGFTLPSTSATKIENIGQDWSNFATEKKARFYQYVYESALALALLRADSPNAYSTLIHSSEALHRLCQKNVKAFLSGLSPEFIVDFAKDQKDLAWAWRNQLEPGKGQRVYNFSESDTIFRNQMGLGMLEYLLPVGTEVLDYLKYFGERIKAAPFRRTEIADEHFQELLPGVPLQDHSYLCASPEVIIFLAKEHHEMWRFSRELSWMLDDQKFHQPKRHAHVPWKLLDSSDKNRDILNAFGVAYMLASVPDTFYKELRENAAKGNPHQLLLTDIEKAHKFS